MVREVHHASMITLRTIRQKVKSRLIVQTKLLRVPLLTPNDIRSLHWVPHKEDGPIQAHEIIVALVGVEFDGESTGVAALVGELFAEGDGRETGKDRCLLADSLQESSLGELAHIFCHFKMTESSGSARMYHPLQRLAPIKRLLFLHEVCIAGNRDTADVQEVLGVGERMTLVVGVVGRIIEMSLGDHASDLGSDVGRAGVGAIEGRDLLLEPRVDAGCADDGGGALERVLERVHYGLFD